jgi:hypothetical protein
MFDRRRAEITGQCALIRLKPTTEEEQESASFFGRNKTPADAGVRHAAIRRSGDQ